jgi:two-component system, chemotaxis family, chemotaxis protein CheY
MIRRILIVDDSPISRKILKSCLPKDREYEIMEAGDGAVGVSMYKEHQPDLTFMDLTMPVMDGVQALGEIIKYNGNAKVVVCTADIQVKSINRVLEIGAYHVVKKPPTKEAVLNALTMVEQGNG